MNKEQSVLSHAEALEQLAHIRTVTAEKRQYGYHISPYFLLWGIIWLIAFTLPALFPISQPVSGMIWTGLSISGWVVSFIAPWERQRRPLFPRLLVIQMRFVWTAWFSIVAVFAFLVAFGALALSFSLLSLYAVLLVAMMYLLLAVVLGREIFFMGMWLLVLAVVTATLLFKAMPLIFGVIGGGSFIVVGLFLRHKGKSHA
ncbi:hypothetical protein [Shouchella lonarensis]|uniref:Uncharacterized protein n=1 Tax=Shouchella lonarensis TaxID=1464122 RepID=A0A1G6MXT2_9BACI|nr:hypothetical protein [Shouchella lonarensis]SDC59786.1 hypothetical protein SAMN05421737_11114 [Shouchella lonarensis]